MNLSIKGLTNKDAKLNSLNKITTLNPNAAEFVPSALRNTYGNTESSDVTRRDVPVSSKKAVLDHSESSISNNSDDEAHQYWRHQLPDDITPDFRVTGEEELHGPGHLLPAGLSIQDSVETSRFSASTGIQAPLMQQNLFSFSSDGLSLGENMGYSGPLFADEHSSNEFVTSTANSWSKPFINAEQHHTNRRDSHHYNGDLGAVSVNDLIGDSVVIENAAINPIEFLSSQFPGFEVQSLADVYYGSGCDLNSTIEILTQLEVDGGFNQNLNSETLATSSFSMLDFPALQVTNSQNGLAKYSRKDIQQSFNAYRSSSPIFRCDADFASAVRKLASQDTGHGRYGINGSADGGVGSSRSSQLLASSYGHGKMVYGDKLRSLGATQSAPVFLETGEAVANMYLESREDAHDFGGLGNTYFEQARQAHLIGNKALAKELILKGQLYNMQMKTAQEKAKETAYRQRNPLSLDLRGSSLGLGQDPVVDLHGLNATEAVHVLNYQLSILRSRARSTGQRLPVMVCAGTGLHAKGTRTPARLPVAVEQYLVEEGLLYTQPRPGLFRVVIY